MMEDLITIGLIQALLLILMLTNTILGIYTSKKKFNLEKFLKGIGKYIVIAFCILATCTSLELLPKVLERINIAVPNDLIATLEILGVVLTAYKKYAADCLDKIKKLMNGDGDNE